MDLGAGSMRFQRRRAAAQAVVRLVDAHAERRRSGIQRAWNWRNYGRPTSPQVGAVVVWRHHVGEIVGQASNGQWIVRSGNDGGAVRTRARSVAGAVFRI